MSEASGRSFPKALRLRRRGEFLAVQRGGRRRQSEHFVAVRRERDGGGETRLGLAVSRKVGNAVERNRVKRRIRELFRTERRSLAPGGDVVVIARPGAAALSHAEARRQLGRVLEMAEGAAR